MVLANISKIKPDQNGNARYVVEAVAFLTVKERESMANPEGVNKMYALASKRANKFGGKKYNTKNYPCHIVFQSCITDGRDIQGFLDANEKTIGE